MTDLRRSPEPRKVAPLRPERPDFESVYRDEFSHVYRMLRYLGAREADVEDLVHDVFVVVHRRLGEFDPSRPLRPWLFGIAFHVAARHRDRFSTSREIPSDVIEQASEAPAADDRMAQVEAWALVRAALQEIDLDQRLVLVMHDLEQQPAPAIAEAVGAPLNTIYSRLRLGRQKLTEALRRRGLGRGLP